MIYFSVTTVLEGNIIPWDINVFFNESIDLNLLKNSFLEVLNSLDWLWLREIFCATFLMSQYSWISSIFYSFLIFISLEFSIYILSNFWLFVSEKNAKLSLSLSFLQIILSLLLCISYNYLSWSTVASYVEQPSTWHYLSLL